MPLRRTLRDVDVSRRREASPDFLNPVLEYRNTGPLGAIHAVLSPH